MLTILLILTLSEHTDSTKIKAPTHPSYNVMAYNTEDIKKKKHFPYTKKGKKAAKAYAKKKGKKVKGKGKKKKKGFFSKVFGSK